ncbi:hypothetical protein AGABI2DRAFT_122910 [Agaricus bisporus var. bisporus H97]|uniref:hypothetical protein n=1 Tax=Agaricus bisporus var. bisporus (strain H97 / ATCC MYA-4626 / FGSC 10389) TaxID=936046 RepID=UPI00029F7D92|nr:hypothetical protein AGABI2DRAFT_122910 [Agaricus bisporus var. bisporus H97]EKV42180.1 hypothetical protein AGABI2DRAFT_122910 [Agaricus bisporus var. bisporus H97]
MPKNLSNICIPSPLTLTETPQNCPPSVQGQTLLYQVYDDYFNMEENISIMTPPLRTAASRSQTLGTFADFNEFFFVLSASSPYDATFTPISPLKAGDIPEALSHLLPLPSNSLLDVINITGQSESLEHQPTADNSTSTQTVSVSLHTLVASKKTPKTIRPLPSRPISLHNTSAATMSPDFGAQQSNIPTSPFAEINPISSPPKVPALSAQTLTSKSQPQHATMYTRGFPTPHFALAKRRRSRQCGWTAVRGSPSWATWPVSPTPSSRRTRGRNSPFPAPIQYDFAPSSIPGSEGTPYCYF